MRRIDTTRTPHAARRLLGGRARTLAATIALGALLVLASASPTAVLVSLLVVLITGAVVGGAILMVDRRTRSFDVRTRPSYATADRLTRRTA